MKGGIDQMTDFEKGKTEKSKIKKNKGLLSRPITSVGCRVNSTGRKCKSINDTNAIYGRMQVCSFQ